ncbi:MAG: hypothetical protein RLZZ241_44 [Bacteroidota bacterium]|jgi:hypothetical protein
MERRIALKNMGMAFGLTIATPTIISILQSCQGEQTTSWTPVFFTPEQGAVLTVLVDIIIPKTDTPSASEVGVHQFIDRYVQEVSSIADQQLITAGLNALIAQASNASGKNDTHDLNAEDLESILATALAPRSPEAALELSEAVNSFNEALSENGTATLKNDLAVAWFAQNLRGSVIWAYKSSEFIGEEVLAYLPVPGAYVPCGDVNELTGGKAWSL